MGDRGTKGDNKTIYLHALCLQLVLTGIIEISVHVNKNLLIGKSDVKSGNVVLCLGVNNRELRVLKDCYWDTITTMDDCDE